MNEFLLEYYYDPSGKKCCLHCKYYFKHMRQDDARHITQINKVEEPHKYGQKFCIKNKVFVWFVDACGCFTTW